MKEVILIGYSGHAHVVIDILHKAERTIAGYCDLEEKEKNPYNLLYFGKETDKSVLDKLKAYDCFVSIGNNQTREKTSNYLVDNGINLISAIHPSAVVSGSVSIGKGVMVGPNAIINANAVIKDGVICNSASVVEHDCQIGKFSHISPGAVLGGGAIVGDRTLIGAGAIVLLNLTIGNHVTVGAGTVVIRNVNDKTKVVGNPQKTI